MKVETKKKPIEFIGKEVFIAGTTKRIGTVVSRIRSMTVDVRLSSGELVVAQFGTIQSGQFCPYNVYSSHPGYYI